VRTTLPTRASCSRLRVSASTASWVRLRPDMTGTCSSLPLRAGLRGTRAGLLGRVLGRMCTSGRTGGRGRRLATIHAASAAIGPAQARECTWIVHGGRDGARWARRRRHSRATGSSPRRG
jgi:hypothetical protein